ncbi:MAG: DUF1015 domain-containing protein, partial [Spirochaetota bacterium]
RPPADLVEKIAELPYDVLDTEEARVIADKNPLSFFHISKPEVDLPAGTDPYSAVVYETGKRNIEKFIDEKRFVEDEKAKLYMYTLVMNGRAQTGLLSCVSIDDYINNVVKKHEFTREDKEQDRIRHMEAVSAHVGLVFLFYKEDGSKKDLFSRAMALSPVYDYTAVDGVRHVLRVIEDDAMISAFKTAFSNDILYIADGHHRAASAVKVGLRRREKNPGASADAPFNWFMSVIFPHDQLMIMPYNRVVKDLNGLSKDMFLAKLGEKFSIEKTDSSSPAELHSFCMYLDSMWYRLKPSFSIPSDPVEALDVSIMQNDILSPILGIGNPRTDKRINFVGGIRGAAELVKLVDSGDYSVAFSMYPTSIEELMDVSDSGNVMPPKSTWFEPKLRSGLVIHRI